MEPIQYITSSTTKIEAGMKYPTVEILTNIWDSKENVNKTQRKVDYQQPSTVWSIKGASRTEGTAFYYTEDESTSINDRRTYREFKVRKMYTDEYGQRDFKIDFYCSNNHTENERSFGNPPASSNNTVFNYVRIGNQYAVDTHNFGIVDDDEIFTIDENK